MRLLPGLTVNVGLRYEYFAPYTELWNHLANLDVSPGFTAVSVVLPGQTGPYSGRVADQPGAADEGRFFSAPGRRLASFAEEEPDLPHRLQHLLQRLALWIDRQQHGDPAAVREIGHADYQRRRIR